MQTENLNYVISAAQDERQTEPFAKAVADSIEIGFVVPSILRKNLEKAGFAVIEDQAAMADYGFASTKVLKRVIIRDKAGTMVAMGAAVDINEALLAALLGWFREHPLPAADVPQGIAEAPVVPSPANPN